MNDSFDLQRGISNEIKVKLTGGLYGATEILVDDDVKRIGNFHKIIRKPFSTLGVTPDGIPANTDAIIVSKNMTSSEWVEVKFDNGLYIRCLPSVEVLSKEKGYIRISDLTVEEELINVIYHIEAGDIKTDIAHLESVNKLNKIIPEPVYFICSKTCNVMLPTFNVSGKYFSFITIKQ